MWVKVYKWALISLYIFFFFFFIMIIIQEEVTQKGSTSVIRDGPLYVGNKKRFRNWVGVDACLLKEGRLYVAGKTVRGREF